MEQEVHATRMENGLQFMMVISPFVLLLMITNKKQKLFTAVEISTHFWIKN